ncbi:MAG: hypothetical protein KKE02_16810 [Alphaproteobacteria bacterium]|nr:hypothetical protein [Alphaproteobacteria bacterium]MBU1516702.1 hypothetical protein [Alphaproteobacteria bacterium]MBU2094458.1 hypothetical protein [Alphaproteobacteria bacterium]MBU2152685.1 hypothetical protein [Alphaproteobacteria bacterium]MBU2306177.1 hypothetical protein [Alphaproteobacteria bacterium]
MTPVLIVLIIFGSIASLFIMPRYFKSVERQKMAETLRIAIEKGQPLPAEVIEAMSSNVRNPGLPPSPQRDLRTGIIWLGIGIGFAALGLVISFEEPDALFPLLGVATFPTFIGLAFVVLGVLNKKS